MPTNKKADKNKGNINAQKLLLIVVQIVQQADLVLQHVDLRVVLEDAAPSRVLSSKVGYHLLSSPK